MSPQPWQPGGRDREAAGPRSCWACCKPPAPAGGSWNPTPSHRQGAHHRACTWGAAHAPAESPGTKGPHPYPASVCAAPGVGCSRPRQQPVGGRGQLTGCQGSTSLGPSAATKAAALRASWGSCPLSEAHSTRQVLTERPCVPGSARRQGCGNGWCRDPERAPQPRRRSCGSSDFVSENPRGTVGTLGAEGGRGSVGGQEQSWS